MDRISELPEHTKQIVLSYLSTKEAAATTVLSRSWRDVWLTLPRLSLRFISKFMEKREISSDQHLSAIHHVLTRRSRCDNKLLEALELQLPGSLVMESPESTTCFVNKWIECAVNECHVKHLEFSVTESDANKSDINIYLYEFPMLVLASGKQEIIFLRLRRCVLNDAIKIRWCTLRSLSLCKSSLNQEVLDSLTANSPLIESLELRKCDGEFDTLKASGLQRLVSFYISTKVSLTRIEINAPSLRDFSCGISSSSSSFSKYCAIDGLALSKGLRSLIIRGVALTEEWFDGNIGQFSELTCLKLRTYSTVKHIRISNVHLLYFKLYGCTNLREVNIDAPKLRQFQFGYSGHPFPNFKLNASTLGRASIHSNLFLRNPDAIHYETVVGFLGSFSGLRDLEIHVCGLVVENLLLAIPQCIRKSLRPPFDGVKHLILDYYQYFPHNKDFEHNCFFDCLLWLSPHPKSISISSKRWKSEPKAGAMILKLLYEEDDDPLDKCDSCKFLPMKCWRHCLEEVTILNEGVFKNLMISEIDTELDEFFKSVETQEMLVDVICK